MLKRFNSKKNSILALDLRPSCLKWVEISQTSSKIELHSLGRLDFSNDCFESEAQAFESCLKAVVEKISPLTKRVALMVPDALTRCKIIQLSTGLNQKEITAFVTQEIEMLFSEWGEQFVFDYTILKSSTDSLMDVLIVGLPLNVFHQRILPIKQVGLTPSILSLESMARQTLLKRLETSSDWVGMLDHDENHYSLCIFKNNRLLFSSTTFSLKAFIEASLNLIDEYFSSSPDANKLPLLWFCSEITDLAEKVKKIEEKTGIMSLVANPFEVVTGALYTLKEDKSSSYSLAFGLALLC